MSKSKAGSSRRSKKHTPLPPVTSNEAFIIDNGAHTMKVGLASSEPEFIPNCIMKAKSEKRRSFIGKQIEDCQDLAELFYVLPFEKGFVTNWEVEKTIWDTVFSESGAPFSTAPTICTEAYFNFRSIQETITQIFFEEYECHSLLRLNPSDLSAYNYFSHHGKTDCAVIVDSGYSNTYIVPYLNRKKYKEGMRRIDMGGKFLTNYLKEIVSYRHVFLMNDTHVVNQMKEDVCYVAWDFMADLAVARRKYPTNTIVREYVLPDFSTFSRGFVRPVTSGVTQDAVRMSNERFTVPELLFNPSDIGVPQKGIPEAVADVVNSCPEEYRPGLLNNVVLTGGNCNFPGMLERVYKDIRANVDVDYDVTVELPSQPLEYAWRGGALLSKDPAFRQKVVTREEYEEKGVDVCNERFDI